MKWQKEGGEKLSVQSQACEYDLGSRRLQEKKFQATKEKNEYGKQYKMLSRCAR